MFGAQHPTTPQQWAALAFAPYPVHIRRIAMGLASAATDSLALRNLAIVRVLARGLPDEAVRRTLAELPRVHQPALMADVNEMLLTRARIHILDRYADDDPSGMVRQQLISSLINEGTLNTIEIVPEATRSVSANAAVRQRFVQRPSSEFGKLQVIERARPDLLVRHEAERLVRNTLRATQDGRRVFPEAIIADSWTSLPSGQDLIFAMPDGPRQEPDVTSRPFTYWVVATEHELAQVPQEVQDAYLASTINEKNARTHVLTEVYSGVGTSYSSFRLSARRGWERHIDWRTDEHGRFAGRVRDAGDAVATFWTVVHNHEASKNLGPTERGGSGSGLSQ